MLYPRAVSLERASLERKTTLIATACAALIIAQQVLGKAARDALFLGAFPASDLPKITIVAALAAIPAVLGSSRLLARFGPARVTPLAFMLSGLAFGGAWLVRQVLLELAVVLLYLHVAVGGGLLISAFWSLVNETFDPHGAKRAVARIGAGATLGGLLGGLIADRLSAAAGVWSTLLALLVLNLVCAGLVLALSRRGADRRAAPVAEGLSSWAAVLRSPYLAQMAALVTCVGMMAAVVDYVFKAEAARELTRSDQLVSFFALFYTVTSLLSFVAQTMLAGGALKRLGIGGTLAILPLSVCALGPAGAALTKLWSLSLIRGSEAVLANSLHRSGYELLYTPLAPAQKRRTKPVLDVLFDRLGDAAGGALVLALLACVAPVNVGRTGLLAASGIAALALWLTLRVHSGYVKELAASLKSGLVTLSAREAVDRTTQVTLSQTLQALDREKLLTEIEQLRRQWNEQRAGHLSVETRLHDGPPESLRRANLPALAELVHELLASEPRVVRRALARRPFDHRAAPLALEWLGHSDRATAEQALITLRELGPRIVGQLVDALLDDAQPLRLRQRIPRVLAGIESSRAARGLLDALRAAEFGVRYRAARALRELTERAPALRLPAPLLLDAAERELTLEPSSSLPEDELQPLGAIDGNRQLDLVFMLLGLAFDREAILLAQRALEHRDPRLRGTALEYLENVLPERLRKPLWARLDDPRPPRAPRAPDEVLADLRRSIDFGKR